MDPRGRRLLIDGQHAVPLEVAEGRRARRRGLLGRSGLQGALLLRGNSVHTFAMQFAIDVAFCDQDLVVIGVATMPPGRVTRPRRDVRWVVEAEAGSFARWGLAAGTQLHASDRSPG